MDKYLVAYSYKDLQGNCGIGRAASIEIDKLTEEAIFEAEKLLEEKGFGKNFAITNVVKLEGGAKL